MRQTDRKKEKDKVAIALMLCFCVIALTTIFTIKSNVEKINSNSGLTVSDPLPSDDSGTKSNEPAEKPKDSTPGEKNPDGMTDDSAEANSQIPIVDSEDSAGTEKTNPSPLSYGSPLKSEQAYVANEFSMDHLIYSATLDQFMVHQGVDITAPEDTQVLSIAPGLVTAVYEDDRYGYSVEVTQEDGLIAIYSNLSDASMVETGDAVSTGTILGGVGTSGLFESLDPPHLHLELLQDGTYMNPLDYISLS